MDPNIDLEKRSLLASLDEMEVTFEQGAGGRLIAFVSCPVCQQLNKQKQLKVVKEASRSWPIFNLTRHFNTHTCTSSKGITLSTIEQTVTLEEVDREREVEDEQEIREDVDELILSSATIPFDTWQDLDEPSQKRVRLVDDSRTSEQMIEVCDPLTFHFEECEEDIDIEYDILSQSNGSSQTIPMSENQHTEHKKLDTSIEQNYELLEGSSCANGID